MPLLFLNPPYSQSSLGEDLVLEDSCRSFCGAAGGSGTHCNPLSWPLSQLEIKVTTLWPSGQWILWSWSFKSGWDWTLPAKHPISQPLSQELYLHPVFGLWGPRAPPVCPASLEREVKPSIHAPKVCLTLICTSLPNGTSVVHPGLGFSQSDLLATVKDVPFKATCCSKVGPNLGGSPERSGCIKPGSWAWEWCC